jgi:hypothetical protein
VIQAASALPASTCASRSPQERLRGIKERDHCLDALAVGALLGADREAAGEGLVGADRGHVADGEEGLGVDRPRDGTEHPGLFDREHRRDGHSQPARSLEVVPQPCRHVGPFDRVEGVGGRAVAVAARIARRPAASTDPRLVVEVVPAVAALVADPPLVDVRILAGLEPVDGVLVVLGVDRAAGRAAAADVGLALQEPDPLLVEEVLVAERAHGAEVDHVAGELVVERDGPGRRRSPPWRRGW